MDNDETANLFDEQEEQKEREHFYRVLNAFHYYKKHSYLKVARTERDFKRMPERHQRLVPNFLEYLKEVRACVDSNYEIIKRIIATVDHMFENVDYWSLSTNEKDVYDKEPLASTFDMEKVHSTMKQFVRDWSSEGFDERNTCYKPIIDNILANFPPSECDPSNISVLVPGAGLGRLAYEIASLGYTCQGNEWSLFMLFASYFILNRCSDVNVFTVYPFVQQYCNRLSKEDQVRAVTIPDVNPSTLTADSNFSMAAGDFLEIYTMPEAWHCIATVFFLDTARNVIEYIEKIWHILKPGGLWMNLGPLLYHYSDMEGESSVELSYEDIRHVVKQIGFDITVEQKHISTGYAQNPASMMKYTYDCVFFIARKPNSYLTTNQELEDNS